MNSITLDAGLNAAAPAVEDGLTPLELERAHLYLTQTRLGMTGAIKGLSAAQWSFAPTPADWSIAQIVDHVIVVLERISGPMRNTLAQAPAPPADRDNKLIDAIIINQFQNRLAKFPAPEFVYPANRFGSPSEGLTFLSKAYAGLAEFLDSTSDLRAHAVEARPLKAITQGAYDLMDGYQWILAAAAHAERHTKQILEVKANDDFPAN